MQYSMHALLSHQHCITVCLLQNEVWTE